MITRRLFLKWIAGGIAAAVALPAVIKTHREPWVKLGEVVDWIGRCGANSSSFCGGKIVREIQGWNGLFYPVIASYGQDDKGVLFDDRDLANFNREVPDGFWGNEPNGQNYPNVHTYVRMQRYGETVVESIRALNFFHTEEWVRQYGLIWGCPV